MPFHDNKSDLFISYVVQKKGLDRHESLRNMTDEELAKSIHRKQYWPRYVHELESGTTTPGYRPIDFTTVHSV